MQQHTTAICHSFSSILAIKHFILCTLSLYLSVLIFYFIVYSSLTHIILDCSFIIVYEDFLCTLKISIMWPLFSFYDFVVFMLYRHTLKEITLPFFVHFCLDYCFFFSRNLFLNALRQYIFSSALYLSRISLTTFSYHDILHFGLGCLFFAWHLEYPSSTVTVYLFSGG